MNFQFRLFLLIMVVHFCLLTGAAFLAEQEVCWRRNILAAAICGCLRCVGYLHRIIPNDDSLWWLICYGGTSMTAFGFRKDFFHIALLYFVLTVGLESSILLAEKNHFLTILLCILLPWVTRIPRNRRDTVPVEIVSGNRQVTLLALRDTGNTLCDPLTGESVMIIGAEAAERLTGLSADELASPIDTIQSAAIPGLRLVPYNAVGVQDGILLAKHFSQIRVGRKWRQGLVAFAPCGLDGQICALTGGHI